MALLFYTICEDIDEIELCGMETMNSNTVSPERLRESAVHMECKVEKILPVYNDTGAHTTSVIWGRVQLMHVHQSVLLENGQEIDLQKLKPVSRAGGDTYSTIGSPFDMPRPKV